MNSLIFTVTAKLLRPILWIVAIWLLLRGHNAPGGGFVAGLVAASAVILRVLSGGWNHLSSRLRNNLFGIVGAGLALCILSGYFSMTIGNPFMTGSWRTVFGIEFGTPFFFDLGVMIVVFGVVIICIGYLIEEEEEETV